jgi:hypothetical protein
VVGRSYPPEFYSWIKNSKVRSLFEKIAIETEEDFQNIIKKLESFGVEVMRPNFPSQTFLNGQFVNPPMTPRDFTVMIGETFYCNYGWASVSLDFKKFYHKVKDSSWPNCETLENFEKLPNHIKEECINTHNMFGISGWKPCENLGCYDDILQNITSQHNTIKYGTHSFINGAMVSRIGKDLYFGSDSYFDKPTDLEETINQEFKHTRNHIINTGGHSDSTYCAVAPGLIISLRDVPTYADTFPGWEVVYLPEQSWGMVKDFLELKKKNNGKWWIPGFEHDQDVVDTVEQWLGHWTGYVEETVFDVNMLIIDPKNVMVFNYNKQVFDALDRFGITPHIVPFRHRYFWDGGIHCVTSDLHREGVMQDYFLDRA